MFKDDYPATYRAVLAYLSRQKQAAANESEPVDIPQAEQPSATPDEPTLARTPLCHVGVPPSDISVSLGVRSTAQVDLSISIDITGPNAGSQVTSAAPALSDLHVRATVAIRSAHDEPRRTGAPARWRTGLSAMRGPRLLWPNLGTPGQAPRIMSNDDCLDAIFRSKT